MKPAGEVQAYLNRDEAVPPDVAQRSDTYPQELKKPHARCECCGRFLKWDDYFGKYLRHVFYDDYVGAYEWSC